MPVTVAVPTSTPPRNTCTVSPVFSGAESVPLSVGEVSLVYPLFATVPCTGSTSSLIAPMVTACVGAWVSMVMSSAPLCVLSLPAASVSV